jgi:hypothetical protein
MSRWTAGALTILAAATLLLTGCRGGGQGAAAVSAPTSATASAEPAAVAPDPARLAGIESTLDRIERELDSDAER